MASIAELLNSYLWAAHLILGSLLGALVSLLTWWASPKLAQQQGWYEGVTFGPDEPVTRGHQRLMQGNNFKLDDFGFLLIGGAIAGGVAVWQQQVNYGVWPLLLTLFGLAIARIDWDHHWIPDSLSVPLLLIGLLFSPFEPDDYARIMGLAAAVLIVWGIMSIVGKLRGMNVVAGGDIMLAGAAGAWLGIHGLPDFMVFTCFIYATYNIFVRIRGSSPWVPLGPAIIGAILIKALLGIQGGGATLWLSIIIIEHVENLTAI